jgi:N-acetylmuramoyl-L-alanine amidase|tara:strand:+ start:10373 stop:11665 length:1293 start_codon:yes stop_codon:yes gene_type:complete
MAIPETTIMNTYLATSIIGQVPVDVTVVDDIVSGATNAASSIAGSAESYTRNAWTTLTDGNIPEKVQSEVTSFITTSVSENFNVVPDEIYSNVANKITPYVSGLTVPALASALRVNNLFGLAIPNPDNVLSAIGLANAEKLKENFEESYTDLVPDVNIPGGIDFLDDGDDSFPELGPRPPVSSPVPGGNPVPGISVPPDVYDGPAVQDTSGSWKFESLNQNDNIKVGSEKFLSSTEELEMEIAGSTRPISEVIVHWSDTYSNANISGTQLQELTGTGNNNYHYIIKRDGSIERGVPINAVGNHCPGHNAYSIGVCLIGGVNVSSGDKEIDENSGPQSLTRTQYNTLHEFFRVFFIQYPGGQALGHGEIDTTQEDPGFQVRDYVYNCFNKRSVYLDPTADTELSPSDIVNSVNEQGAAVSQKNFDISNKRF